MLRGLRKASSNWLGKVIMAVVVGFLIISFGVWGIGDIFRGFGVSTVAKVGRTEISIDQFRTRQLRLSISADEVEKQIKSDPAFRGFNGQFDLATYLQRIREVGYTQQRFEFEQRQTTLRRQIAEAVGAGLAPPKA